MPGGIRKIGYYDATAADKPGGGRHPLALEQPRVN